MDSDLDSDDDSPRPRLLIERPPRSYFRLWPNPRSFRSYNYLSDSDSDSHSGFHTESDNDDGDDDDGDGDDLSSSSPFETRVQGSFANSAGIWEDNTATEEDTERIEYGDNDQDDIDDDDEQNGEENDEEEDEDDDDDEGHEDEVPFDASAVGLKEISNLASFTVSSYKPGCGVKELRDDDVNQFWQSDGPQPHRLNIHFVKRVEIRAIRFYLDYELDESYTPTKIQIFGGWGANFVIPFKIMDLNMPKGWIDVPIAGAGGGPDGNSMCCWFIRIVVLENHQNGKDTHIRGIKVYALDDAADTAENNPLEEMVEAIDDFDDRMDLMNIHDHDEDAVSRIEDAKKQRKENAKKYTPGDGGLTIPDFMREPEIR
ncbi:hypothetical protein ABKA04_003379 [Annulohypoxylon sp. FPYF3050]